MYKGIIVDDAAVMRMRLRDILEKKYQVVGEAEDGKQALALYLREKPDFITLDITMPHVDGLEALDMILSADPAARVVIVSAVGQKKIVFDALSRGAKDFIVKPFDPERVILSIDRLFA
jgi:two-component system, chemotaxis family, chemotaxis protein CheY